MKDISEGLDKLKQRVAMGSIHSFLANDGQYVAITHIETEAT
jgi:hypothetical protein